MNKKYMDFVPIRPVANNVKQNVSRSTVMESEEVSVETMFVERKRPVGVSSGLKEPKFGVIEDFQPKFVKTEVSKRPLSTVKQPASETAAKAKAKLVKVPAKNTVKMDKIFEAALRQAEKTSGGNENVARVPKDVKGSVNTPFVNTEKVMKRPLSKNVYQKKIEALKEVPSGPVTIITKPEKDSRVGMVVAIVLTIILGAAAGTVAFLLLPK